MEGELGKLRNPGILLSNDRTLTFLENEQENQA